MLRPNFLTKDDDIDRIDKTERVATRPFLQPEGLEQDFLRYKCEWNIGKELRKIFVSSYEIKIFGNSQSIH